MQETLDRDWDCHVNRTCTSFFQTKFKNRLREMLCCHGSLFLKLSCKSYMYFIFPNKILKKTWRDVVLPRKFVPAIFFY